jgi:hypothetical protein
MGDKNNLDIINQETLEDVSDDLLKIFGNCNEYLTKSECRNVLNIVLPPLLIIYRYTRLFAPAAFPFCSLF